MTPRDHLSHARMCARIAVLDVLLAALVALRQWIEPLL
jgi:hypothetical protein